MNTAEARALLTAEMEKYRAKTYGQLASMIGDDHNYDVLGPSGTSYHLDIQAFWDNPKKPNEVLRIMGAIDDGGFRAYVPMTDSFLMAPDGAFVGE